MNTQELAFSPAHELRKLIAKRQLSSVELTDTYLRRIQALDSKLNAFLTVVAEDAINTAKEADKAVARNDPLGPLHGVPIAIKDLMPSKGIRTTKGSLVFKNWVPEHDDISVERIRAAGAPPGPLDDADWRSGRR